MAEFHTELTVNGTKEEYISILNAMHYFADERHAQYRKEKNCWFLGSMQWSEDFGEITEQTIKKYMKKGRLTIALEGPYGVFSSISGDIDLFERLTDAAPACAFKGVIWGWNAGGDQGIKAKLEGGKLYILEVYEEGWCGEDLDEEEFGWDTVYDPKTHSYSEFEEEEDD